VPCEAQILVRPRPKDLEENDVVSPVVLTAQGAVFRAGFDRSEFGQAEMAEIFSESLDDHRQVYTFPKPIIAAVNGPGLGGGAREAWEMGFVNFVCEPESLMRQAEELAAALATLPQPMPKNTKQKFLAHQPALFQPG
jgi:enoyl-CoA hydratase/carnithine racemase